MQEAFMIPQHFINSIRQLSLHDRMALIEEISRSLREEMEPPLAAENWPEASVAEKLSLAQSLCGILKTEGPPPTDEEIKEGYAAYLTEKYS
jgi:hypothetical protein